MVLSLHSIGFSCIVFLALLQVATGLECYICTDCSSVSSSTKTYNTTLNGASCSKTVVSASGVTTVARAALVACAQGTVGGLSTYCCSTDLCNGSGSLSSSLLLALALATFATMSKMILIN
ncbi:unnamed protein product [Adineta steineri]|uniref:Snake toxin/toxin-like domain-containing protein n=1 Tax=Adineta steineri TaxID=433720 RepID=A0A816ET63_9BILA|nr:unnamed protein product [Adineta steineri]CAF1527100.1 unnamed protein product [Adineta steineri]CAF1652259.1 unnamed protein product [Adineta steineri]CAF3844503.1 unnamed protein product [Adineta steineri]